CLILCVVRDLSGLDSDVSKPLHSIGSLSGHTRPVECLRTDPEGSPNLVYSADSMGLVKIWELDTREPGSSSSCHGTLKGELRGHRTRINDMWVQRGQVWTGEYSSDEVLTMT